jgi:hypothetical protein
MAEVDDKPAPCISSAAKAETRAACDEGVGPVKIPHKPNKTRPRAWDAVPLAVDWMVDRISRSKEDDRRSLPTVARSRFSSKALVELGRGPFELVDARTSLVNILV